MKIKRQDLIDILAGLKPALAKTEIINQATHFIFTGEQILTYNDRICIRHPFTSDFSGSVPSDEFYKVLNQMSGDEINLEVKDGMLLFSSGELKGALSISSDGDIISLVELLDVPSFESKGWKSLPDNFKEAITFCMFSASKVLSLDVLSALFVDTDRVISSDNMRISIYFLNGSLECGFLLPVSAVEELVKLAKITDFILGDSWIHFRLVDKVIFSCRLFLGQDYHMVDDIFDFETCEVTLPNGLKSSIEATSVLASGNETEKIIDVLIDKGRVKCKGQKEIGWVESDQKIDYNGPEVRFGIHPHLLLQILNQTSVMEYGEGKAIFKSDSFEHLICLIPSL